MEVKRRAHTDRLAGRAMTSTAGKTAFEWDLYRNRSDVLQRYRQSGDFMDGVLESKDGVTFPVHLVVISGLGDLLTKFMYDQISGDNCCLMEIDTSSGKRMLKRIKFHEVDGAALKTLIDCAYTGELRTDVSRVWNVLRAADTFAMKEVTSACCSFLCRHVQECNCLQMYRVGKSKRHSKLIQSSMAVMRREIVSIVRKGGPFFQTIEVRDLKDILCADELGTVSEEFVWEAIKAWIACDPSGRESSVDYLLSALRFHRTSLPFLKSLKSDPLIVSGKRRGRSLNQVDRMFREKTSAKYRLDGRGLPVGREPVSIRPRIPKDVLFGIGGWKGGRTTNLIETYDLCTNQWFELAGERNAGPAQAYYGHQWYKGRIYMFGGTDGRNITPTVRSFDPETRDWKTHTPMKSKRCYVATAVLGGMIYAVGGHNGTYRLQSVERYDPEKDEWAEVQSMSVARSDAGCAVLHGKMYAVGGLNENSIEASVEYYDPVADTWTMSQEMSSPRTSLAVVTVNDMMYALGGNRGDSRLRSCERFDPGTSTWLPISPMFDKRSTFAATVLEGKIFVAGGYDGHQPFSRCECYDPLTDTWSAVKSLNSNRSGLALVRVTGIRNASDYTFCGNE